MPELLTDSEKTALEAQAETAALEAEKQKKTEEAEAAPAAGEEIKQDEEPRHKKGGFIRKIEKLETQNELLARQNQELMERLAGKSADAAPVPATDGAKPKLDDFKTYEDYIEALTDWKIAQKAAVISEAQTQDVVAARYAQQAELSRKAHPDWDEAFAESGDIEIHPEVQQTIVEHDNGSEVAYYLAKNPELAQDLARMPLRRQIAEIGRISAVLERSEAPAPVKPRTAAPAPITPVSGGSTTTQVDPSKMSMKEYRAYREAMES